MVMAIQTPLRSSMTAIAAVIALSSTSLFAQSTDSAASQDVPAAAAPPVVAPAVAEIAAPEAPAVPSAVEAVPAAPAMRTMSTPVIHTEETPVPGESRRRVIAERRAAPAAVIVPVAARGVSPTIAATAPKVRPAATIAAVSPARPSRVVPARAEREAVIDSEAAPIIGLAGLGALAVGGAAFALRRRKRDEEDEDLFVGEPAPVQRLAEPMPVRVTRKAVRRTSKVAALPNGFDLSHYGPHVQAAYGGPTKDNPFLSLRRRLSRARFYDQREREAAEAAVAAKTARPTPAAVRKTGESDDRQVTIRLAPQRKRSSKLGFAFQK